jgi:xylulokinase
VSEIILAVDLGAGSLRAAAVTKRGRLVTLAAQPIDAAAEPQPGWSELDPEIWWRALATTVGMVLDRLPRSARIAGLCLAGLTRSQVLLDGDAQVLRPALLFRDRRAVIEAEEVSRYFATENPPAITAFHPLARLAWLTRVEPTLFERVAAVAEPKDFLNARLTGRLAGDSVTYSRFDDLALIRKLPPTLQRCLALLVVERLAPWASLGPVTCREAPFDRLAGVPVFAGSMDAWASAVGAGAVRPGQAYDIAGTSEVVGLITRERRSAPGLVSLSWGENVHQIGGPTQAGADSARWCHEVFRLRGSLAASIERAGALLPTAEPPLFLPYLAGERTPLWREDLRAAFHLVSRTHGPDDFLFAVLEGVAHAVREILTLAATGGGEAAHELRICGGGARSDAWCQLKADITGLPVLRASLRETGLSGCAIAAAFGLGLYPSLAAASDAMVPAARVFTPRSELAAFYRARAQSYSHAQAAALEMVA